MYEHLWIKKTKAQQEEEPQRYPIVTRVPVEFSGATRLTKPSLWTLGYLTFDPEFPVRITASNAKVLNAIWLIQNAPPPPDARTPQFRRLNVQWCPMTARHILNSNGAHWIHQLSRVRSINAGM